MQSNNVTIPFLFKYEDIKKTVTERKEEEEEEKKKEKALIELLSIDILFVLQCNPPEWRKAEKLYHFPFGEQKGHQFSNCFCHFVF